MAKTIRTIFQFRRGTTEEWLTNKDVVPAAGEPCFDLTAKTLKIGDGTTTYENLPVIGGSEGVEFAADGKSVVLTEGVLQLLGFAEAPEGAQPRKNAAGELEWVVPSTETVDGLQSTVAGLKSDIQALQDVVGTPVEGEPTLAEKITALETKVGEESVDDKIDAKLNEFATNISPEDGIVNSFKELVDYVAEHGPVVDGILTDIGSLQALVGEKSVKEQITEAIANSGHIAKAEALAIFENVKYEISSKPVGTLVDYREKEIRVMCPSDTQWVLQQSGEGSDPNNYYIGFKAYAPDGAVGFREDTAKTISDTTVYSFEENPTAGIDSFGRKYSIVWLPVATYNPETTTWSYHGAMSGAGKYVGWYYSVEWIGADDKVIGTDTIRINLSNEVCHNEIEPFYMNGYVKGIGAGLKASEEITIAEDGTLGIGTISFAKIAQAEDEEVILDGGDSSVRI